jgi:hypothetical protein
LSWFECATICKNLRKAVDRFILLVLDFSTGAALAAGGAPGLGRAAALGLRRSGNIHAKDEDRDARAHD